MNSEIVSHWLERFAAIDREAIARDDERLVRLHEALDAFVTSANLRSWYQRYLDGDNSSEAVGIAYLVDAYKHRDESIEHDDNSGLVLASKVWRSKRTRQRIVDAVQLLLSSEERESERPNVSVATTGKIKTSDRLMLLYKNTPESMEWESLELSGILGVTDSTIRKCEAWKWNRRQRQGAKAERRKTM
tara:strand:- start:18708 stop:19274 length:567 start_codon:yes stop_codon:yes gene_type:complete